MEEQLTFAGGAELMPHLPLALEGLGLRHLQEDIDRPEGILPYQWIQSLDGCGILMLDGISYKVPEGCGMFLPSLSRHAYRSISGPWYVSFLCFNGRLAPALLKTLGLTKPAVYKLSQPEKILAYKKEIYQIYQSGCLNRTLLASQKIYSLLTDLAFDINETNAGRKASQNEKVHAAVSFMESNFYRPLGLADIAENSGLSKEYMCQLFKSAMGCTVLDYLLHIRLSNAKAELIKFPGKKIEAIAAASGFETSSYFCAVFKKYEGMTPGHFRKSRH